MLDYVKNQWQSLRARVFFLLSFVFCHVLNFNGVDTIARRVTGGEAKGMLSNS